MAGGGLAVWSSGPATPRTKTTRADLIAAAALLTLAAGLGAVVFWQRLSITADGIRLYGDYDTADLSWYAGVAAEASHTVPPTASYYSGHQLNAAYYAHLVLAMIHRFCDVPILSMFLPLWLADIRCVGGPDCVCPGTVGGN